MSPSTNQPTEQRQEAAAGMQEVALTPAPSVATASAAAAAAAAAAPEPRRKQGARSFMVANAALRNWSTTQFAALLLLTVVTQLSWGLYGVCTRYLQVETAKPIPTLQLMVCLNLLAWPGLILFATLPNWAAKRWDERKQRLAADQAAAEAGQQDESEAAAAAAAADGQPGKADKEAAVAEVADEEAPAEPEAPAKPQLTRKQRFMAWLKPQAVAHGVGSVVVFQALTNVYAAKLANAYVAQMIFLTAPLFAAFANRLFLKQPTPYGLWPTVALSLTGSALVVVGQMQQNAEQGGADGTSAGSFVLGCCLALLSTLLLTVYLILIQVTRHLVTGEAVLWANRNVALVLFIPLSLAIEGTDWSWVAALPPQGWGVLVFTGLYIYTLANLWLQFCTRALGAALISAFLALRLLSAVVGSIVMLNETPNKAITWVGLGIVGVTTAGFVVAQHQHKQRKAAQAAAAAAAADEEAARQAAEEGRSGGELVPQAAGWSSFMSHGASFLRGPRSFLGDSAATFRRRQLRAKSAPSRVSFMAALGHSTDTGYSPELLLQRDLEDSDDESECEGAIGSDGKGGGEGGGSPASSKPASSA